ncbi:HAD-like domain-containing protein [Scenedesmus sp. NREL 46B-D3]|nr:HAD-like domain-containing protein [Scenedesmus sp. NREL 46B-D3]
MATKQITHVIFDMDGLLLDTETFYTIAQQEILAGLGKEFSWDLKVKMMGKKALDAAQVLIDDLQLHGQLTAQQFLQQREAILDRLFPSSPLMPGAERLIRHLHGHQVPIAVATSSHRRHFDVKTQRHGQLFDLFDLIVTGDQVTKVGPGVLGMQDEKSDVYMSADFHLPKQQEARAPIGG